MMALQTIEYTAVRKRKDECTCIDPDEALAESEQSLGILVRNLLL